VATDVARPRPRRALLRVDDPVDLSCLKDMLPHHVHAVQSSTPSPPLPRVTGDDGAVGVVVTVNSSPAYGLHLCVHRNGENRAAKPEHEQSTRTPTHVRRSSSRPPTPRSALRMTSTAGRVRRHVRNRRQGGGDGVRGGPAPSATASRWPTPRRDPRPRRHDSQWPTSAPSLSCTTVGR
jgi:hypothetical protein